MEDKRKAIGLLFDRPKEPLFVGKGDDEVIFDIPESFIAKRFQSVSNTIKNRMKRSENPRMTIEIDENQQKLPDLQPFIEGLPRDKSFSIWIPKHAKLAEDLIRLFMEQSNVDNLLKIAVYVRDEINSELFNYSLTVAVIHRKDTRTIPVPSLIETFPYKFFDPKILRQAREALHILPDQFRAPIVPKRSVTTSPMANNEQKLWYFREDLGINLHHWHWHLVYPHSGIIELVAKDRRGELFYYMHEQIMARYNNERISNGMPRVEDFSDFKAPIPLGYSPKLDTLVANRSWPSRPDNIVPDAVLRDDVEVSIDPETMNVWLERFREVVEKGFAINADGEELPLDEFYGIDILGNLMESTIISPNREFYGNLHNYIHLLISYAHDPKNVQLEDLGVVGDATTAVRDPSFFRIHSFIDKLFQEFRAKLQPYSYDFLSFPEVEIISIQTQTDHNNSIVENQLFTFWQQSDVNLSRGLDFSPRGDVFVRITHLQHSQFTIRLRVNNKGNLKSGTVRIFLSSKFGFNNEKMEFNEQRLMMIEIDRFSAQLHPGMNLIQRRSTESAVTIPHEQTFRNLENNRPPPNSDEENEFFMCGCGWPQHMLIPKGSKRGMKFELFVMLTNEEEDRVEQTLLGQCTKSTPYCGVRDRQYPDRRAMGFPFDRNHRDENGTLASFLTPNMKVQEIDIIYQDKLINKGQQQ